MYIKGKQGNKMLKNWRPISLLNVVYKIGSACTANRLKVVLSTLIDEDQTGFMVNRFIGDNVQHIHDLISNLHRTKLPGLLLCSVDWNFMFKVLHTFGFGPDVCLWVSTFYKGIKTTVAVNGQLSQWFLIQCGCRQGDPNRHIYLYLV